MTVKATDPRIHFVKAAIKYVEKTPTHLFSPHLASVIGVTDPHARSDERRHTACYMSHLEAKGKTWYTCGTQGCLLGVLMTMPEVHDAIEADLQVSRLTEWNAREETGLSLYTLLTHKVCALLGKTKSALWDELFEPANAWEIAKHGTDDRAICVDRLKAYGRRLRQEVSA